MARKKINPLATALTIAAIGATGWAIYNFIIKPRREKKRAELRNIVDSLPAEILDAQTELIDNGTTA